MISRVRPILFTLIASVFALTGCDKDLEYDVPTSPPQLVVNSVFTADSLFQIEVSNSASPGQGSQIQALLDCEIELKQNDKLIKDLELKTKTEMVMINGEPQDVVRYYYGTETTLAEVGLEYEIEVSHSDYKTATSSGFVPYPADIQWLNLTNNDIIDVDGKAYRKLVFQLQNNSPQKGYFAIQVLYGKDGDRRKIEFFANDPIFNENQIFDEEDRQLAQGKIYDTNQGIFFSSESFTGQTHSFDIFVESHYLDPDYEFEVRILTFTRELYEYSTALQRQQSVSGNPFAEPVQVYSNVSNGFGIFNGYSLSVLPYAN